MLILLGLIFLLILFSAGYYASLKILNLLVSYFTTSYKDISVIALTPYDIVVTILRLDLLMMTAVVLPFLLVAGINYVLPALYEKEKRLLYYVPVMAVLGTLGIVFGWAMAIKIFIPYLQNFATLVNITNSWSVIELISFILTICTIFAVVFQIPIVVTVLVNLNVIKLDQLVRLRKGIVVLALIFGAAVTPQTDPVSQLVVALPFYLLFELSIQFCLIRNKLKNPKNKSSALSNNGNTEVSSDRFI